MLYLHVSLPATAYFFFSKYNTSNLHNILWKFDVLYFKKQVMFLKVLKYIEQKHSFEISNRYSRPIIVYSILKSFQWK